MNKYYLLILISLLALFHIVVDGQNETCSCETPITAATFNTLQIFFAPYEQERLNTTIDYFNSKPAYDVLCLQELWDSTLRDMFIKGVNKTYPYVYYAPQEPQECTAGCTDEEIQTLLDCLIPTDCLVTDQGFDQLKCAIDGCHDVIDPLSSRCKRCLTLETGVNLNRKLQECAGLNESLADSCQYLYNGWSDTLLLSPYPFNETDSLLYADSPLVADTVLYGKQFLNNTTLHVFCTHMAAALPLIDSETANLAQSHQILEFVYSKLSNNSLDNNNSTTYNNNNTMNNDLILMMGDFNHGPAIPSADISSTYPMSYFTIITNGSFVDSMLQVGNSTCTYCSNNTVNTEIVRSGDLIIDHIYIPSNSSFCIVEAGRFATLEEVSVQIPGRSNGPISLSDHYGVQAQFCFNSLGLKASNGQPINQTEITS